MENSKEEQLNHIVEMLKRMPSDHEAFHKETLRLNEEHRKDPSLVVNFLKKIGQIK